MNTARKPNLIPVAVAASGPQTFRCCRCFAKVTQDPVEHPAGHTVRESDYRRGTVWADLDGTPFTDYYCTPCKQITN